MPYTFLKYAGPAGYTFPTGAQRMVYFNWSSAWFVDGAITRATKAGTTNPIPELHQGLPMEVSWPVSGNPLSYYDPGVGVSR